MSWKKEGVRQRRKTKKSQCKKVLSIILWNFAVQHMEKIHLASTNSGNHDNSPSLKSSQSCQSLTLLLGVLKCSVVQQPVPRGCLRRILCFHYLSLQVWARTLGVPAGRTQAAGQPLYLKSKHWIPFLDTLSWAWPPPSFRAWVSLCTAVSFRTQ